MLVLRLGKMGKGEEGKVLKIVCPAMGPLPYGRGSVFLVSGRDSWTGNNDRVPGFAHSYQHPFPFFPLSPLSESLQQFVIWPECHPDSSCPSCSWW